MTGVNPGKHAIFDFLARSAKTYGIALSSTRTETGGGRAAVRLLRKSRPFWHVLGEYGVFSTILRVPITYPPEPFRGVCLAGMCVPDLRGTQGTFSCFTTAATPAAAATGGEVQHIAFTRDRARCLLKGPPDPRRTDARELEAPLDIRRLEDGRAIDLRLDGQHVRLRAGTYSEWLSVRFRAGPFRSIHGICRFYLADPAQGFKLYVTPINIDPGRPALPISHPPHYAIYLAGLHGPFATLGLAEDTWARNEGVIDDATFLQQVYSIHDERERMFFDALRRTRHGLCACVFDASDRVQHMFTRPATRAAAAAASDANDPACEVELGRMYERMDGLVGRVVTELGPRDTLFVISDHGFTTFRRGVNLNAWLREHGYLDVRADRAAEPYLQAVDWGRTRAYTFGLSGIYLNRRGREGQGIVEAEDVDALKRELIAGLRALVDDVTGKPAIKDVYDAATVYRGPYADEGPDLIVGYADGYRASWEAATGRADGPVFSDNTKAWAGDHCVDRSLVPGVFFANRRIAFDGEPGLADIAPTVLALFGIAPPAYMDGRPLALTDGVQ
jgi:predicted AlkP superfamily phosphohydrolase/phosphomutase